jgi:hypothetical protein
MADKEFQRRYHNWEREYNKALFKVYLAHVDEIGEIMTDAEQTELNGIGARKPKKTRVKKDGADSL